MKNRVKRSKYVFILSYEIMVS
ncbi:hypothetical protein F383_23734 [Gossypium arboreum]|uniref:Uncharacterized protein n=1 Tax=Gossypium arboreum TaxID=29729 RepID=A0A0B0P4Y0_GOSAR|nr:hypothetical protein F383_23734 [Gossypium arboreum]